MKHQLVSIRVLVLNVGMCTVYRTNYYYCCLGGTGSVLCKPTSLPPSTIHKMTYTRRRRPSPRRTVSSGVRAPLGVTAVVVAVLLPTCQSM